MEYLLETFLSATEEELFRKTIKDSDRMHVDFREKLLSWSLQVTDLENLTALAFKWYERGLDHPNLFTFTKHGEFFFSSNLDSISRVDWNYLISILGATCVGFLIECSRTSAKYTIRLWKLENGSLSTCSKEITGREEALGFVTGVEQQLAETGMGYEFQRNWQVGKEKRVRETLITEGEDYTFTDEEAEFYEAKLHLELLQPPREHPGDFTRHRLK
ncbi:MAG: hypothetical protein ACFFD4_02845 [Candidatus Odinarchaeota archaeon]